MATNYPAGIDSLTNPGAGDALNSPSHAGQHANANDAIEAIETELGATPSGSESTVAARLTAIESGARMGTGSIGATALADNAVDTAAIQAKAVTAAKIADDTITATQIAANAVGVSELADNAVDTAAVADSAITTGKVAAGAVTYDKLERQPGNLLTKDQASLGTDTTGLSVVANCSIARVATPSHKGAGSLEITCNGAGTAQAGLPSLDTNYLPAVTEYEWYTATVWVRSAVTARSVAAAINWRDSAAVFISTDIGQSDTTTTGGWTEVRVTAKAPVGARYAQVVVRISSPAASEVHYADAFGLWLGVGGRWQLPGTPVPGLGQMFSNQAVSLEGLVPPSVYSISASVGSTYLQTTGAASASGTLLWRKTGGADNAWTPEGALADTGWRNLAASLANGWTATSVKLRRVGAYCTLHVSGLNGTSATNAGFLAGTIPAGMRPESTVYGLTVPTTQQGLPTHAAYVSDAGWALVAGSYTTVTAGEAQWTWPAGGTTPWPATLPGSAA